MKYNKIDFSSKHFITKWFDKRIKDTLPVERLLSKEELDKLHANIHFTKKMFPHVLQNNIIGSLPTGKE